MGIFTAHAAIRVQQRDVPPLVVDWLLEYGSRAPAGQGVEKVYFDKQARRDLERSIGGWAYRRMAPKLDAYLVVRDGGTIITAGWRTKRLQH